MIADVPVEQQSRKEHFAQEEDDYDGSEIEGSDQELNGSLLPVALAVIEFLILQALASRPGIVKSRDALMVVAS